MRSFSTCCIKSLKAGATPNNLKNYKDPIKSSLSRSQLLHFPGYTTCENSANAPHSISKPAEFPCSYSCDFTMTAALTAQLLSNVHQWSSFSTSLWEPGEMQDWQAGSAVSIISVTCPARQPAAPPVIRRVYSGAENTGLNLAVRRSLSLPACLLTNCSPYSSLSVSQSVSQGQS